jgi:hypothetical protein
MLFLRVGDVPRTGMIPLRPVVVIARFDDGIPLVLSQVFFTGHLEYDLSPELC